MSTAAAARMRRYRERLKAGKRLYEVELDEVDADELLAGTGCESLTEVLELLVAVTRNDTFSETVIESLMKLKRKEDT